MGSIRGEYVIALHEVGAGCLLVAAQGAVVRCHLVNPARLALTAIILPNRRDPQVPVIGCGSPTT